MITADSYLLAVTTLLSTAGLAWATFYAGKPKRRLLWYTRTNLSLLGVSMPASSTVTVTVNEDTLTRARMVELVIKNAGRHVILANEFSSGEDSLVFDFGVPVKSVLDTTTIPKTAPKPGTITSGNLLKIRPELIKSQQETTFFVLVDGPEKWPECLNAHLITPVKETTPEGVKPFWKKTSAKFILAGSLMTLMIILVLNASLSTIGDPTNIYSCGDGVYVDATSKKACQGALDMARPSSPQGGPTKTSTP
ncbi:hypothetical protein ACFWOB_42470 [Streptomyces sp. NPDC058420]|uniref:hypothetical protein n=1 Tax=Streptomyces sp. NPDC058420 TaxID=3346489 RepID=UPI00364DE92D